MSFHDVVYMIFRFLSIVSPVEVDCSVGMFVTNSTFSDARPPGVGVCPMAVGVEPGKPSSNSPSRGNKTRRFMSTPLTSRVVVDFAQNGPSPAPRALKGASLPRVGSQERDPTD